MGNRRQNKRKNKRISQSQSKSMFHPKFTIMFLKLEFLMISSNKSISNWSRNTWNLINYLKTWSSEPINISQETNQRFCKGGKIGLKIKYRKYKQLYNKILAQTQTNLRIQKKLWFTTYKKCSRTSHPHYRKKKK